MASAPPATKQDLETAHLLADAARDVALPLFRSRALATESKADTRFDPVTEADRAIEARMREILAERHPDDGIVGEEHGIVTGSSGRAWVIDPIDGTRAFISGLPVWGVLIGLRHYEGAVEHGRSILGILDQPYTGERFVGTASGGERRAELHRGAQMTPLGVRPCAALEAATLMCTTPALFEGNGERAAYDRVENAVRLPRYGADCYQYAMLAAGHVDLVIEAGLAPYDIQALIPIIEAAGGLITDWEGNPQPWQGRILAAGDARVHEAALKLLNV